jgi:hypothetical protein
MSSARKRSLISSRKKDYREGITDQMIYTDSPIHSGNANGVRK